MDGPIEIFKLLGNIETNQIKIIRLLERMTTTLERLEEWRRSETYTPAREENRGKINPF